MPIYEYRCEQGHTFEVMQRMSDDPVATCQTCEAPVERVFHPVAVHFKGSGFYNTDYGTRKRSRELKEAGEAAGKSEGKSDSDGKKSDSTPGKSDAAGSTSTATKSDSAARKSDQAARKSDQATRKSD